MTLSLMTMQVSRKGRALHDKAVINCQFSMATFSTGQRKKRPRGDKWVHVEEMLAWGVGPVLHLSCFTRVCCTCVVWCVHVYCAFLCL